MFTTRFALTALCAYQPAQLDAQSVGVLLLKAVEPFHALGGLLVGRLHATQESLHAGKAGTDVESPLRRAICAPSL